MSKGNDRFQPHGIYNRLITFIVDHLIVHGQKKVTLGGTAAMPVHESIEVPIIGTSRNVKIVPSNTSIGGINGVLNNEVVIDFRHIEEEEEEESPAEISTSTSFRKLSSQINFPNYNNGFILRAAVRIPVAEQGKERGGGGRSQHSADLSKKEESADHCRETYTAAETATPATSRNESEDAIRKHDSRSRSSRPPLKSVASNINEKADAFIRSRKEVMKKNFGYGS